MDESDDKEYEMIDELSEQDKIDAFVKNPLQWHRERLISFEVRKMDMQKWFDQKMFDLQERHQEELDWAYQIALETGMIKEGDPPPWDRLATP